MPSLFHRLARRITRQIVPSSAERGFASASASLALVSFLGVAAAATTVTMSQTSFDFTAIERLVDDSVGRVGASLEVRGSVVARAGATGTTVETIQVPLSVFGDGLPVPLDAGSPDHLRVAYMDDAVYDADVPYGFEMLSGDGDSLLEAGEAAVLTIDATQIGGPGQAPVLTGGTRFTLELNAPVGGVVSLSRRLPPILQPVMPLP